MRLKTRRLKTRRQTTWTHTDTRIECIFQGAKNVHNLFETSPQPTAHGKCYDTPCPHKGPWCNAAYVLTVTQHLPDPKLREDRCTPIAELGREGQGPAIFS